MTSPLRLHGREFGLLAALTAVSIFVSGCVMARGYRNSPLDETVVRQIERGVTTKRDILDRFGPPQELDSRELVLGGAVPPESALGARYFRYTYWRANGSFFTLILFSLIDLDLKSDSLVVFFDENDVVEDFAFAKETEQLPRFGLLSR